MIAVNLQTSFLTPPFGFALFYFRGIAPVSIKTIDIYKGVLPFVIIQIIVLLLIAKFPEIALWLPEKLY
jgi:TRAP-type mannitol/chloroaromatic compound transport system permease large subunit